MKVRHARAKTSPTLHVFVVLSLFVLLAGCYPLGYLDTNLVDSHYTTDQGKTSPLGHLPSLKINLEVEDQRPDSEQDKVGIGRTRQSNLWEERTVHYALKSKTHPVAILYDAMTKTLDSSGHTIVRTGDLTSNILLQAQLKKFLSYPVELLDVGTIMESAFEMDIDILTKPGNNRILSKHIRAVYRMHFFFCHKMSHCYRDVLNEGLKRFIQSFSDDPEVLEALRSVAQKSGP